MNDHRYTDVYEVNDESGTYKHCPYFLYRKAAVLAELVVQRSGDVLERNDLLFGKSSYRDLEDGDSAVTEEGETDDEIKERYMAVDRKESNNPCEKRG